MLVFPDGVTMVHRAKLAEFAKAHRLPSMFDWREYCDAGGLASYGANQRATYVRLAIYADPILRGEKPADLPVEQPTKFELVMSVRTARALGVTSPPALLVRAARLRPRTVHGAVERFGARRVGTEGAKLLGYHSQSFAAFQNPPGGQWPHSSANAADHIERPAVRFLLATRLPVFRVRRRSMSLSR
jgi:hypothetical protein